MNAAHVGSKERICLLAVCLECQRVHLYDECHVLHHQNAELRWCTGSYEQGAVCLQLLLQAPLTCFTPHMAGASGGKKLTSLLPFP